MVGIYFHEEQVQHYKYFEHLKFNLNQVIPDRSLV